MNTNSNTLGNKRTVVIATPASCLFEDPTLQHTPIPLEILKDDLISVRAEDTGAGNRHHSRLDSQESSRPQHAPPAKYIPSPCLVVPSKKSIFITRVNQLETEPISKEEAAEDTTAQNGIALLTGHQFFAADTMKFMISPVPAGMEYTLVLHRTPEHGFKVYFDRQQELVSCTRHLNIWLLESSEGPVGVIRHPAKSIYQLEAEDPSVATYLICHELVSLKSKHYLNSAVYERPASPLRQDISSPRDPTTADEQSKFLWTRSPSLIVDVDQKPRLELPMKPRLTLPTGTLRPSRYHCVMRDQQNRDRCVLVEESGLFVAWVGEGLSPLVAVACALTRADFTENDKRKKFCLFS